MADAMTQQLVQSLKGYFRVEEFSDKVIHIIEMDAIDMRFQSNYKKRKNDEEDTSEDAASPKKTRSSSATPALKMTSTPYTPGKSPRKSPRTQIKDKTNDLILVEPDSDNEVDNFNEIFSSVDDFEWESVFGKEKVLATEKASVKDKIIEKPEASTSEADPVVIPDEVPKKLFHEVSFFLTKSIIVEKEQVRQLINTNGGSIVSASKTATYLISHYLLPTKKKAPDTRERTIKWMEDCISEGAIKPSFMNVLYRPIAVKAKPLSDVILTLDSFEKHEKELLLQIGESLGASNQDLVFSRQRNNSMFASTHLVLGSKDDTDTMQYKTAVEWSIPCVTKAWLWKCLECQELVNEKDFLIETMSDSTDNNLTASSSSTGNNHTYSVFPVHSLILSINSPYFKTLISDSGMRETKLKDIEVKVNAGEGKFLELLIHSFYDQDILKDLQPLDLLKVLELADRYLCDIFIKRGLSMLKRLDIKTVDQCNLILEQVKVFQVLGSTSSNETYTSMRTFCSKFLSDYFCPVECYLDKHETFNELSFDSILLLLSSTRQFLWHENSVIYFIVNWLAVDEERQSEENIEKLLTEVRYEHMTVEFFKDVLSTQHTILSKWDGYLKWYIEALIYHGITPKNRKLREIQSGRKNRALNHSKSDVQSCVLKLVHFKSNIFKQSWVNYRNIIYQGYILTPVIIFSKKEASNTYKLILRLYLGASNIEKKIENFYQNFDIAVGVFPGLNTYKPCKIFHHCGSNFIKTHFRPIKVQFEMSNVFKKSIGTIDEGLFEKFKEHGITISIAFRGSDLTNWPSHLRALNDVTFKAIHRKSTFKFGVNDVNPDSSLTE